MRLAVLWHDRFREFFFAPRSLWPTWIARMRRFRELLDSTGLVGVVSVVRPPRASLEELLLVRTRDHVKRLLEASRMSVDTVIDYGDTISYPGFMDDVLLVVGATLRALSLVVEEGFDHAYQPLGGLHHARRSGAAGFLPCQRHSRAH